jgi:hypothetical protein
MEAGCSVEPTVTIGDTVSTTVREVTVAVPLLVTITYHLTVPPGFPFALSCFHGITVVTGATAVKETMFVDWSLQAPQASAALTSAVFETTVSTGTTPTRPEMVKV